jgi:translation initiation factor IF-3
VRIINELLINEQIRDKEVRLIGSDGEQIGIVPIKEAQKLANEKNLDLVKIAPQAKPPVCKIMDYGKYKFDAAKKEKEARKKQKTISVKEIRLSASIEKHDFQTKMKNAQKFIKDGDKVKISVVFRGREMMHTQKGSELLQQAISILDELVVVEQKPKLEGRNMVIVVAPK